MLLAALVKEQIETLPRERAHAGRPGPGGGRGGEDTSIARRDEFELVAARGNRLISPRLDYKREMTEMLFVPSKMK